MVKCKLCKKKLSKENKSGFCTQCYTKSPQSLEYQRNFQKKWYSKKQNKLKKKKYLAQTKVRIRYKKYQKKYQREHIEQTRIQKREWARKNRKIQDG